MEDDTRIFSRHDVPEYIFRSKLSEVIRERRCQLIWWWSMFYSANESLRWNDWRSWNKGFLEKTYVNDMKSDQTEFELG